MDKLFRKVLEAIAEIDAAVVAKKISPESAEILRKQAVEQAERLRAADKSLRPTTRVAGANVPAGGLRAAGLTALGGGLTGAGVAAYSAFNRFLENLSDKKNSTDPKSAYLPSLRDQGEIRQEVANRNAARELGNIFLVNPTRAAQSFLNIFLENDIPLKEFYKMEDPGQTITEDVQKTEDSAAQWGARERALEATKQSGPVSQEEVKANSAAMQMAIELLKQRGPFNNGVPTQTRTESASPYQY